jgi:hypothetical protein
MNIIKTLILICSMLAVSKSLGQGIGFRPGQNSSNYMIADTSSTLMFPVLNKSNSIAPNKPMDFGADYYLNIIFYDFITEKSKKLFDKDTYIANFNSNRSLNTSKNNNITSKLIFYKVYNIDHNKNGDVDEQDPAILYVSDNHGNNLKALTTENESVIAIDLFEKQNFALIKIQRDIDKDGFFKPGDNDYYYVKVDLKTLAFGNKIELK